MSTHIDHDVEPLTPMSSDDANPGMDSPAESSAGTTQFGVSADRARAVLEPVWRDWRIGAAAAAGSAAAWGCSPDGGPRAAGRNGEEAGVGFTLRYDEQRSCVFGEAEAVEGGTHRVLPVWPDGYSATSNPLTIRDFDGMTVAVEGRRYEGAGGYHDPVTIGRWSDQTDTCGVDGAGAMVVITR